MLCVFYYNEKKSGPEILPFKQGPIQCFSLSWLDMLREGCGDVIPGLAYGYIAVVADSFCSPVTLDCLSGELGPEERLGSCAQ